MSLARDSKNESDIGSNSQNRDTEAVIDVLTETQIDTFCREGVLVVPGILSPHEVERALKGMDRTLLRYGVDASDLSGTGHNLRNLSSTNGSGGVLDLFYPGWKMDIALNERLWKATTEIWRSCYCHSGERVEDIEEADRYKWQPRGSFDPSKGFAFVDRIGYRLPTAMAAEIGKRCSTDTELFPAKARGNRRNKPRPIQRSLTPHLDCCPDTFDNPEGKTKWRPVQCFVSLTDNTSSSTGGFEAAPGFHRTFHQWSKSRAESVVKKRINGKCQESRHPAPCFGNYTHIRPTEDSDVMAQVRHIPVRAGDAVFWDERIPHSNSYRHDGCTPRAVVYCSFLPDVELNRSYARQQLEDWKVKRRPRDQWIEISGGKDDGSGKASVYEKEDEETLALSSLGGKLLGLEKW
mmetsp:Transcript_45850/g.139259  ORF Transcript_45850/g.139259 Transcript_45850/m.139259 type:complete len:407 (-) Transcript_45850:212-1432(-)